MDVSPESGAGGFILPNRSRRHHPDAPRQEAEKAAGVEVHASDHHPVERARSWRSIRRSRKKTDNAS